MTTSPELVVRPLEPNDHLFLAWTIRRRARADRQLPPMAVDDSVDALAERTTSMLERNARSDAWLVLVAEWRGERVGYALRGPSSNGGLTDRYVDPWFAGLGIERALQEAVDLGWAVRGISGAPRRTSESHPGPTGPTAAGRSAPQPQLPVPTGAVPFPSASLGALGAGSFQR